MIKTQLGQFFTTNSDYILQGLEEFIKNKEITNFSTKKNINKIIK